MLHGRLVPLGESLTDLQILGSNCTKMHLAVRLHRKHWGDTDVDIDLEVLRAKAYASMPTSYIINYIY